MEIWIIICQENCEPALWVCFFPYTLSYFTLNTNFGYILRIIDVYDSKVNELNLEKNPPDILCTPDLGNMSQYKIDSEKLQFAYDKGYESALNIIDDLKKKLRD